MSKLLIWCMRRSMQETKNQRHFSSRELIQIENHALVNRLYICLVPGETAFCFAWESESMSSETWLLFILSSWFISSTSTRSCMFRARISRLCSEVVPLSKHPWNNITDGRVATWLTCLRAATYPTSNDGPGHTPIQKLAFSWQSFNSILSGWHAIFTC